MSCQPTDSAPARSIGLQSLSDEDALNRACALIELMGDRLARLAEENDSNEDRGASVACGFISLSAQACADLARCQNN